MKTLVNFIHEAKSFRLSDGERDELAALVGVLSGVLGMDEDDEKLYKDLELSDDEKKQLEDLYDVLDDTENYRNINRSIIKDDIDLIVKIITWMDENDAWSHGNDYELINILDKLTA